jgi:hypothetical protein
MPEQSAGSRPTIPAAGFWSVLLAALVLQLAAADPYVNVYDEGIILAGARSVFLGELPYKDFWTMYGPGQFYLSAWLFSFAGPSDLAVRAIGIVAKASIVALTFVAIGRLSGRVFAVAGAMLVAGVLIAIRQDAFPVFPAVALALGAILLLGERRDGRPAPLVLAGVLTGLSACFRHDLGAYGAVAAIAALLIDAWLDPSQHRVSRLRRAAAGIGLYGLGILSIGLPVAGFFWATVPVSDLYENLIYIPSTVYPEVRALPWPAPKLLGSIFAHPKEAAALAVYVPLIVCCAALGFEVYRRGPRGRCGAGETADDTRSFLAMLIALTGLLFMIKGAVRVSNIHMVQALVLAVILIPTLLAAAWRGGRWAKVIGAFLLVPVLVITLLLSGPGFRVAAQGLTGTVNGTGRSLVARCTSPLLPTLRCVDAGPNYVEAARFVMSHSSAADTIYVGTGRHDKLFVNAVAFYFLAERMPATKWYELHPGVQTQLRIQEVMIREMTSAPPRFIVLDSRWDGVREPNRSAVSSGAMMLDEFISSKYSEVARFGPIRVLGPR